MNSLVARGDNFAVVSTDKVASVRTCELSTLLMTSVDGLRYVIYSPSEGWIIEPVNAISHTPAGSA